MPMKARRSGFTLIELLVVVTVIALLAGITIGTLGAVQKKAARGRSAAEIAAIETALERYKVDFGDYPAVFSISTSGDVYAGNPSSYLGSPANIDPNNGQITSGTGARRLFAELMGRKKFTDAVHPNRTPYLELKEGQIGDKAGNSYIQDPFGYAYGYYYNPAGVLPSTPNRKSLMNYVMPDIWSTGGETGTVDFTNKASPGYGRYQKWITNWSSGQ
jgi:prepilin-type N-terminal cleavage/methylation domain-containing protein